MSYLSKITKEFADAAAVDQDIEQRARRAVERAVQRQVRHAISEHAAVARARRTDPAAPARIVTPAQRLRFSYAPDVAEQLDALRKGFRP